MQLELAKFAVSPATHIVSLGEGCDLAYNLRRHFNFASAFPFDWWYIANAKGLSLFLENPDIDLLYDPSRLEVTYNARSVRHRDFDLLLHHEFPRQWDVPGSPIRDDWREHIERPKQRTAALMARLLRLNASEKRIAFVRHGQTAEELPERLARLFPLSDWTFIALTTVSGSSEQWQGDPNVWNNALGALGLTLDRTGHREFQHPEAAPEFDSSRIA